MTKFTKFAVAAAFAFGFFSIASAATVVVPPTLMVGSTGAQVMNVQTNLGIAADGSFGPMTQAAVMAFQASHGLTADGKVGPMTAAAMNAMTPVTPTPTPTEDGEDEDTGFDGTLSGEGEPNDIDVNDADDNDLMEGDEEAELGVLEFTSEDGDIMLSRVDVTFVADGGNDEMNPWRVFDSVYLMVDGDVIAEAESDSKSDWDETDLDDTYRLRFSGLDFVAEEDADIELVVAADIASSVEGANDGETWDIFFASDDATAGAPFNSTDSSDGVRYEDADGFVDDFSSADSAQFNIDEEGADDGFELKSNSDDPDAMSIKADEDTTSDEEEVFIFTLNTDNDSGDLQINEFDLDVEVTDPAGGLGPVSIDDDIISEITVEVDGDTFDGDNTTDASVNNSTGTATYNFEFDEGDFILEGDDTEVDVKVMIKFRAQDNNYDNGTQFTVAIDASTIDAEGVDSGDTVSDTGTLESEQHGLFAQGIAVTFDDSTTGNPVDTSDVDVDTKVTYTFDINVEKFDEDVWVPFAGSTAVSGDVLLASSGDVAANTPVFSLQCSGCDEVETTDNVKYFKIDSSEETMKVTVVFDNTSSGEIDSFYAVLNEFYFTTTDAETGNAAAIAATLQTVNLGDEFETDTVALND